MCSSRLRQTMTFRSVSRIFLFVGLFFGGFAVGEADEVPTAPAPSPSLEEAISRNVREVFHRSADSVVQVLAEDRHGGLRGTGFCIDPSGTILTLYSTVADASKVEVLYDGELVPARVLMSDARSGLALLKIDRDTPFLPSGSSRELGLASPVLCIGYPMDLGLSPSFGLVGGFDRKFFGKYFVTTHLRANIPVQPGLSGAPILNFEGEVVGILIAGIDEGASCFALPIEAIDKVVEDYRRFGEARHGWVGVTVESRPGEPVRIAALGADTPAAQCGLKQGDVLLGVGNVPVDEVEDVLDASFFLTEGDDVVVRVMRDGRELDVPVRSIRHPSNEKFEYAGTELRMRLN